MKACSKCGVDKPLSAFSAEKRSKDGKRAQCKACISVSGKPYREATREQKAAYDREYRKRNAEKLREQGRAYAAANVEKIREYRERNRERRRQVFAEWAERNKERLADERRQKYYADPEAAREKAAQWRAAHPEAARRYRRENAEKIKADWHKRRALQVASGGSHTAAQIRELLGKQRGCCAVCRVDIRKRRHVDHIVPLSKGGSNDITNIQLTCRACNLRKHAREPVEFMQSMGYLL